MYLETNSSQVLFSISQKLIQHQIVNYTDILRWLREVLTCRNSFLLRHRDYANVGSQVSVAKQAHIKLEVIFLLIKTIYFSIVWLTSFSCKVVFFLYLWSIDMDAVLVSMSCFNLLCEEADIRCGIDDVTVTYLLPNYHVYQELAAASTVLTTGKSIPCLLTCLFLSFSLPYPRHL